MIVSVTAGIFLMFIGLIIWRFKLVTPFVGRRSGKDVDREGLARWIGTNLIMIGITVSVAAIIQVLIFQTTYMVIDFIIILILSTRMAVGTSKFRHPKGTSKKRKQ